uniref:RING-type domain-containing protein n=1 Tax=Leptobrachium leishanense TaxID=445787 RepID=A0A8C5PSF4_9ANUR
MEYSHFLRLPELTCSFCLNIFTDPVTLPCGHSFCRTCIGNVMDTQGIGEYSCPECKEKFRIKPALKRNQSLSNITESFQSAEKRIV